MRTFSLLILGFAFGLGIGDLMWQPMVARAQHLTQDAIADTQRCTLALHHAGDQLTDDTVALERANKDLALAIRTIKMLEQR